jgi:hypothetical protein
MHRVLWHVDGTDEIFNLHLTDPHDTKKGVVREIRKALGPRFPVLRASSTYETHDPVMWVYVFDAPKSKALTKIILRNHNEANHIKVKEERFILLDEWRKI